MMGPPIPPQTGQAQQQLTPPAGGQPQIPTQQPQLPQVSPAAPQAIAPQGNLVDQAVAAAMNVPEIRDKALREATAPPPGLVEDKNRYVPGQGF
jgi:hypothetical protein